MTRYTGRLPRTYAEAVALLNGRTERKLYNVGNTEIIEVADGIAVLYHGNTIAKFYENGSAEFHHCGWVTRSTFDRLNAMTPPHVGFFQRNYEGGVRIDGIDHESVGHVSITRLNDGTLRTEPVTN